MELPLTSSESQKAIDFYKKLWHSKQCEGLEARNNFYSALRIDPNFILANLILGQMKHSETKYRQTAVANKSNGSDAERIKVDIWLAGRDGKSKRLELAKELVE